MHKTKDQDQINPSDVAINPPTSKNKHVPLWITLLKSRLILSSLCIILFLLVIIVGIEIYFENRLYPGITIANISVGNQTPTEALQTVHQYIQPRLTKTLTFTDSNNSPFIIMITPQSITLKEKESIENGWKYGRDILYFHTINIPLDAELSDSITQQIKTIAMQLDQPAIDAQLKEIGNDIAVSPSQQGIVLDQQMIKQRILEYINTGKIPDSPLPMINQYPHLTYQTALSIKKRLDEIKASPIKLTYKEKTFPLDLATTLTFLDFSNVSPSTPALTDLLASNVANNQKLVLNEQKVNDFLQTIANQINHSVQEPLFDYDPNQPTKVRQFSPPIEGTQLNIAKTENILIQAIETDNTQIVQLPVDTIPVKNQLTNNLGIKQLIAHGESEFAGSPANRIFNIKLGAQKINGTIVLPGATFSFDQTVGNIDAASGFKSGLAIIGGRTVLDDGGGICQVSTTLFRAALKAGIPIVARTAHAYRVHYYEQDSGPGFDATIYSPNVDFKFKNDTPGSILIQTTVVGTKISIDLYGTSDGRVVNLSKAVITSQTAPPDPLYQDDPTLPVGTTKQVDYSAWGTNTYFTRTVTRNDQTISNETFHSNFRPWQAVYLVGTKPA